MRQPGSVRGRRQAFGWFMLLGLLHTVPHLRGGEALHYYGHQIVRDRDGVIAPWYQGLNGQCDLRVRIAAETLKRYPWTTTSNAIAAYPAYVFSGTWQISSNGVITPLDPGDWANGDLSQRATSVLNGFVDYYRYTGDAAAIAHLTYFADYLIDHCVTPADHAWPRFFISVPVMGKAFWQADPHGMIQLDLCASTGQALLRAYQLTGNPRWLDAAKHWGDLLAEHCNLDPSADPWPRYVNPDDTKWKDNKQTGGVTMILGFLDELIRLGAGDARMLAAREAGQQYLRDKLLPAWLAKDTWGRYFWDWANDCQNCLTTPDAAGYLLNHPREFPNWRCDARNILTLFLNRASVAPESNGDVYSGAWAYPESAGCCGRSLWYAPICSVPTIAQYAAVTDDHWARELAYRQAVLQTYDVHETGVTEDNIDGGIIVNGDWLNIAHPLPLRFLLAAIGWLPEQLGACRENHIARSTAVVSSVIYGVGRIEYTTFDAPTNSVDVLRLAFAPKKITADGLPLSQSADPCSNGYAIQGLPNGDAIVSIRHDGARHLVVTGPDPQHFLSGSALEFRKNWHRQKGETGVLGFTESHGASVTVHFTGNQVRLIGSVGPDGGLADLYLDGERQLVHVDCWSPIARQQQVLYYRNGLPKGKHALKLVARGTGNPHSSGARLGVEGVQFSAATGTSHFPSGAGPREVQRFIFGYPERTDYGDSAGHTWRPGTEFVSRAGSMVDSVAAFWWTNRVDGEISGTKDPELYRYGVHGHDFWINATVGPGDYYARLKLAATRGPDTAGKFDVRINGDCVAQHVDVAAAAGAPHHALELVFPNVRPRNGIIQIRFTASSGDAAGGDAFVQAVEIGPENK